jgi:two-component system cell cycle response regulator
LGTKICYAQGMKVLVYSPGSVHIQELYLFCADLQLEMDVCTDTDSAWNLFEMESYSAMIIVAENTDMSGFLLIERIRSNPRQFMIPILFLNESEDWEILSKLANFDITEIFSWEERNKMRNCLESHIMHKRMLWGVSGRILCLEQECHRYSPPSQTLWGNAAALGFEVGAFYKSSEIIQQIQVGNWDLLLVDASQIKSELWDALMSMIHQIRTMDGDERNTPVLALCDSNSSEQRSELMRLGSGDFLSTPLVRAELASRLSVHLRLRKLLTQVELQKEELHRLAMTDPLTGLLNRHSLGQRFESLLQRVKQDCKPLSLLLLDLDFFKKINDQHGHDAGDHVLRKTSALLLDMAPKGQEAYRLGGEEFLLIWPEMDCEQALEQADTLRRSLEILCPLGLQVTGSFGLVTKSPWDDLDFDALFALADQGAYEAKSRGRNQVVALQTECSYPPVPQESESRPQPES